MTTISHQQHLNYFTMLMVKDVDMVELATENIPIIENRRRRRG